jgi:hypothetical protein
MRHIVGYLGPLTLRQFGIAADGGQRSSQFVARIGDELTHAALAGLIPLPAALAFDAGLHWLAGALVSLVVAKVLSPGLTLRHKDKIKAFEAERLARMPWLAQTLLG